MAKFKTISEDEIRKGITKHKLSEQLKSFEESCHSLRIEDKKISTYRAEALPEEYEDYRKIVMTMMEWEKTKKEDLWNQITEKFELLKKFNAIDKGIMSKISKDLQKTPKNVFFLNKLVKFIYEKQPTAYSIAYEARSRVMVENPKHEEFCKNLEDPKWILQMAEECIKAYESKVENKKKGYCGNAISKPAPQSPMEGTPIPKAAEASPLAQTETAPQGGSSIHRNRSRILSSLSDETEIAQSVIKKQLDKKQRIEVMEIVRSIEEKIKNPSDQETLRSKSTPSSGSRELRNKNQSVDRNKSRSQHRRSAH